MADGVFNNVKGEVKTLCQLSAANDAIIFVPVETTGLEADDTLNNYDDLQALLAASNNEQTTMGRKTVTSTTITVDDTANRVDIDIADQTWTGATGNAISKMLLCHDADTTAGTDANIRPITYHDFVVTPDGTDVVLQVATAGFFRAQ